MKHFYEALSKVKTMKRPVRIAYFGDSFIEADIFTADLREMLQQEFGGCGVGYVPVTSSISGYRPTVRHTFGGWSSHSSNDSVGFDKMQQDISGHYFFSREGAYVQLKGQSKYASRLDTCEVSTFYFLNKADRMLDMGFYEDIMQIAKYLPKERQTIMFSATMPAKIQQLANTILNNPSEIKLAVSKPAEKIIQAAYVCYENQKLGIIRSLFMDEVPERVIVFASSKIKVKEVAKALKSIKLNVGEMHSDLEQAQRETVMHEFKAGRINILVATDIVARGIDIDDIRLVINFDVPHDSEDYVHRIGRTARANNDGVALTFISEKEQSNFKSIENFLEKEIYKIPIPEELGEAPEYKPRSFSKGKGGNYKRKDFRGKRNNNNGGKRNNRPSPPRQN
jgi:superfamily II DNA/RNA helicase